ncbi:electron transfer flavoprotein subunit alpha/FixB family protein [Paracholeplasma manati]|uniref:Electron transfer flavoprotein subunit alpha/FixB family protein n=1 Tax=Paracholeplasma manati TaxID=591373 RepID=A0ABT2Y705_9MOLU|nr:electron transfer flavoprotein subunit alpha/FixB family protein [Paracholeplasma manati]MCV2232511.1 electron transfer flavoprotein subunit alpha/FixB family protein [Paracholeplasma manati]MDG0888763.1 electron transfer flavoprotein subunit alpha/FixB family protein [Paracholeplasma manati]
MGYIKVDNSKVTKAVADQLKQICPFNAFEYVDEYLSINASCRVCKLCVKKGPKGVCEFIDDSRPKIDKSLYKGIAVFMEQHHNVCHPVGFELLGKAKEIASKTQEKVYAIVIGSDTKSMVDACLSYGVDDVFVYEDALYGEFNVERYTHVVETFYKKYQNNVILFGSTPLGRSFAPRVAARLRTGLTADCTMLDITEEGDLLQIRPAFGGNIMAKINTPNNRPQLATIRYKMFNRPAIVEPFGQVHYESVLDIPKSSKITLVETVHKPQAKDISESEIIIALGRGIKKQKDLELIEPLRALLGADLACTRPLIENGWFDARHQIGLSGRTVKPKLLINIGISGSVHFIEGMKESETIITINQDPRCKLFDHSHYAICGDLYQVVPKLNELLEQMGVIKHV